MVKMFIERKKQITEEPMKKIVREFAKEKSTFAR